LIGGERGWRGVIGLIGWEREWGGEFVWSDRLGERMERGGIRDGERGWGERSKRSK